MRMRLLRRLLPLLFYVCLDAVAGSIIYFISVDEAGLEPGQLAMRILTALALVSVILGGPDIMLYWLESGRRMKVEDERDAAVKERDRAVENAAIVQRQLQEQIDELRSQIDELQSRRRSRQGRRRRLRDNGR